MSKTDDLNRNERGFASIVIALVLIIVLALLTIGFAQLARREQQNALDKQLATQAYDAAETGINDTWQVIQQAIQASNGYTMLNSGNPSLNSLTSITDGGTEDPNKCLNSQFPLGTLPNNSINSNGASYSCVLLNLDPPNLQYSDVNPGINESNTFYTTGALDSLTVKWGSADNHTTPSINTLGNFTPDTTAAWGNTPAVLQVSITPLSSLTRSALISNSFTTYLYPSASGPNSITYNPTTSQGSVISGDCGSAGTYPCSATINGLNGSSGEQFLINILYYYDKSNVSISAADSGSNPLDFVDGQAQIDATGQARTALKRIQVRRSLGGAGVNGLGLNQPTSLPPIAVQAQNICKRLLVAPSPYAGPYYDDPYGSPLGGACNPDN